MLRRRKARRKAAQLARLLGQLDSLAADRRPPRRRSVSLSSRS
jgi:hypothetical protein